MRTYSALLLFENLFDSIPTDNPDMVNLSLSIMEPNVQIIEKDCGTTLGRFETVNFELEGTTELATGLPLSRSRIEYLLSQGIYEIATRHTSTCISKDGVCTKCFVGTYPLQKIPVVNDRVNIYPLYLVNSEIIAVKQGGTQYSIETDSAMFDTSYLYHEGVLLLEGPDKDYTLENSILTFKVTPDKDYTMVLKTLRRNTFPFIVWLANTYSGGIFGMEPLPAQALPLRTLFLSSLLDENRLQLVSEYVAQLEAIPEGYVDFAATVKDPLERGLYLLALYCVYSNVI